MIETERRLSRRKQPQRPTYINLESEYPGKVQDISESGLQFRVIDPLEPFWEIHFSFNANSKRIRGTGDLVWTDAARKTGGLRFTHLPEETREQIRRWLEETSPGPGANKDSIQGFAREASSYRESNRNRAPAPDMPLCPSRSQPLVSTFMQQGSRTPAPQRNPSAVAPLPSLGTFFQEICRPPFKTIIATVMVMILTISSAVYRRVVVEWLTGPRARASGRGTVQTPSLEFGKVGPQILSTTGLLSAGSSLMESPSLQPPAVETTFPKTLTSNKRLFVQVAAVRSEVEALEWFEILGQRKLPVFARKPSVDGFYQVLVGPYPDEDSARITQRELERSGYESFIRH